MRQRDGSPVFVTLQLTFLPPVQGVPDRNHTPTAPRQPTLHTYTCSDCLVVVVMVVAMSLWLVTLGTTTDIFQLTLAKKGLKSKCTELW